MPSLPFLFIAALFSLNPVTITVYPPASLPPATFRVTVIAPRHADNRALCYSVEGPELKSSCFTLNGERERRSWTVYWELRTAGEYEASAVLTRIEAGSEHVYRDRRAFRVIGLE